MDLLTKNSVISSRCSSLGDLEPCDSLSYRGFEFPIYMDPLGQQVFVVWVTGELLPLGRDNTQYKESLKMMIDDYLDVICR